MKEKLHLLRMLLLAALLAGLVFTWIDPAAPARAERLPSEGPTSERRASERRASERRASERRASERQDPPAAALIHTAPFIATGVVCIVIGLLAVSLLLVADPALRCSAGVSLPDAGGKREDNLPDC